MTCIHGYDSQCGFCADRRAKALDQAVALIALGIDPTLQLTASQTADIAAHIDLFADKFLRWTLQPIEPT